MALGPLCLALEAASVHLACFLLCRDIFKNMIIIIIIKDRLPAPGQGSKPRNV